MEQEQPQGSRYVDSDERKQQHQMQIRIPPSSSYETIRPAAASGRVGTRGPGHSVKNEWHAKRTGRTAQHAVHAKTFRLASVAKVLPTATTVALLLL